MNNIETNNEETDLLSLRIKKLAESQIVISTGKEYEGLYELTNKSAEKYLRANIRGSYFNVDTGDLIKVTRKGAEKVTRHDAENLAHLKSLALIPELIRKSIFIAEDLNEKNKNEYDTFRYYVVGLKMEGIDYTVKLAIGVKNGCTYYDHALTPIEINKLLRSIDEIKRPFASKESSDDGEQVSDVLSECKDKRLISILQAKEITHLLKTLNIHPASFVRCGIFITFVSRMSNLVLTITKETKI